MEHLKGILALLVLAPLGACAASSSAAPPPGTGSLPALGSPSIARVHPNYAFSCNSDKYLSKTVLIVHPGTKYALKEFTGPLHTVNWYYPIAGFCGIDNSFLTNGEIELSNNVYTDGEIVAHVTLSPGFDWKGKPDIAVWEEAWVDNFWRDPSQDVHVSLLHVISNAASPLGVAAAPQRTLPDCTAPSASLPGNYILFESSGNVTRRAYTAIDGTWTEAAVAAAPTPQPTSAPHPRRQETYLYSGTYHLNNHNQSGCAYLETTAKGEPFVDSANNASVAGLPDFNTKFFAVNVRRSGTLSIGLLRVTDTGGHAALTLHEHGAIYDSGTMTFTQRIVRRGP